MQQKSIVVLYKIANEFINTINQVKSGKNEIGKGIFIIDAIESNKQMSMTEIAEIMKVPASTATRLVDKLVKSNLIKRSKDESKKDRRIVELELTDSGKELYDRFQKHQKLFLEIVSKKFSPEEIEVAFRVLEEISRHSGLLFKI